MRGRSRSNPVPPLRLDERLEARDGIAQGQRLAFAGGTVLYLGIAFLEAARANDDLVGDADEVGRRELAAGGFVPVVVERIETGILHLGVERRTGGIGRGVAGLEVDEAHLE